MTPPAALPADATQLYSPIGLRLVDELTGADPIGTVVAVLDILDANGDWQPTGIQDVRTLGGILAYPGLERHADIAGLQSRQYRIRLTADFYVPFYRATADSIRFTADPWSEAAAPAQIVGTAVDTLLLPAPNYPFAAHIQVLRGGVVDAANAPVPDVYVTQGNNERALTDARGTFALPLRWVLPNTPISIDATDQWTGRHGSIVIRLPDALRQSQTIGIS